MKKLTTLLASVLLTATIWAQSPQKMSYQAVIRNASNTLVSNTTVGMQISILQTTSTGTAVYVETQTPTTNANGLVSIEIGGGTVVSGTFSTIDWSAGPYFIKTETDPTGGTTYSITGTSQLLSVPYALSAGNVTGLEKITEGSHTGWRLIGQNPAFYGDIGNGASDLSMSANPSTTLGATGAVSTAMGSQTTASGDYSTAMGFGSIASGAYSTAMGGGNIVSGDYATAIGLGIRATAYASVAMGIYNIGSGSSATTWVATDPLFEIGNGTSSTSSNALTILKNGTITAPSFDLAEITNAKALITKEYADTNLTPTGLEKITEGGNTGWRLVGQNPANYGNIGSNATDLSYSSSASTTRGATRFYSVAMGFKTTASEDYSTAMGNQTTASHISSTAMGQYTTASGRSSTAMGGSTTASGAFSTAMGTSTTASGLFSTSMGFRTKARSYASVAIGQYNIGASTDSATWVTTDPVFEIGNGTSGIPSNALTVLKNGNTDVSGLLRAGGNVWPTSGAGVEIAYNNSLGIGYIQSVDRNTNPDTFHDLAIGASSLRPVSDNFTSLGTSTRRWTKVYALNGTIQTSDRRMKKDINIISYGLNTIMKLHPVSYKWKKGNQDVNLGLIAQEVQKLIPEMVDVGTNKAKTLGLKYTELIPVLIKATQEQQKEITELKSLVKKLLKQRILVSNN